MAYSKHCLSVYFFPIKSHDFKSSPMCCCLSRPIFSTKIFFSRSQIVLPGASMNTSRSISSPIFLPALYEELALPSCPCQDMVLDYIFYLNLHISPSMLLIHCPTHIWAPSCYLQSCTTPSTFLTELCFRISF